jgi:uracil-DNA glycosylase
MNSTDNIPLTDLLRDVRACTHCEGLPLGPRPVLSAERSAKILVIGQAPGTRVHATGIPWNDPSGDRLRRWMGLDREQFYNAAQIAIMPMGFCYPGRGKSGDLPPRPECAPRWHPLILEQLPQLELTLLIGQYAQQYYLMNLVNNDLVSNDKLNNKKLANHYKTLTERVKNWRDYLPLGYLPLVHPSPRNQRWLKNNPWFEDDVVPVLRQQVKKQLGVVV